MKTFPFFLLTVIYVFNGTIVFGALSNQTDLLPGPVQSLIRWPAPEVMLERRALESELKTKRALCTAEEWIRKVIDPVWFPKQFEPQAIRGEFENRDVVRYKWVTSGRGFMVAQTGSIFLMEVTVETGKFRGNSISERLVAVRELFKEVFSKSGTRWTGQLEKVPILRLNEKVAEYSFGMEQISQDSTTGLQLFGKPKSMKDEGVVGAISENRDATSVNKEMKSMNAKSNPAWEKSPFAWSYWFRNIYWFSDDQRMVIYFIKHEGGPIEFTFSLSADDVWLK